MKHLYFFLILEAGSLITSMPKSRDLHSVYSLIKTIFVQKTMAFLFQVKILVGNQWKDLEWKIISKALIQEWFHRTEMGSKGQNYCT